MTAKLTELWGKAYRLSHVAADITEKQVAGKESDHQWLSEVCRELNCVAQSINSHTKGERTESVRHD